MEISSEEVTAACLVEEFGICLCQARSTACTHRKYGQDKAPFHCIEQEASASVFAAAERLGSGAARTRSPISNKDVIVGLAAGASWASSSSFPAHRVPTRQACDSSIPQSTSE